MQQENETHRDFLIRTDTLSLKLQCNLDDLPVRLGISRASIYAYRTGKRPISGKSWLKLEQAERTAEIHAVADLPLVGMAGSQAAPESSGEKPPGTEDPFSFQAQIDALKSQIQVSAFTLAELETRMVSARAWPASSSDRQLTPAQLWGKYAP